MDRHISVSSRFVVAALILTTLSSAGCAGGLRQWWHNDFKVGPNYFRPAAQVADDWIDSEDRRLIGEPADDAQWWTVFNDPVLNNLVQTAYEQNLPLRIAAFRVLEARAQAGVARGSIFPQQQNFFADYQHQQVSRNNEPPLLPNIIPGVPPIPAFRFGQRGFDFMDVGFDAAWELDIWGKFRRNIEAANAGLDANIEDYDDILVTLIGDVAATYVQIRTLEQQLVYQRQNVTTQKGSLDMAEARFKTGATSELDVTQAQNNLANTRAAIPSLEASLRQAENQLCILLGIPPQNLRNVLGEAVQIPTAPPQVAVGIPADLLRQRPDVRAAERQAAAQSARIGVAYADLFPSFSILGSIQLESSNLSTLFAGGSVAGFIGAPGVNWKILNYGRLRNNIRVQDALFQQAAVSYENTVLVAGQEVENSIVGFLKAQQRYKEDLVAVQSAKRSVELASIQYREGAIDFNRVFTLESILANQQLQLAETQGNIAINLIGIYKALGGGWQIRLAQDGVEQIEVVPEPVEGLPEVPLEEPPLPPMASTDSSSRRQFAESYLAQAGLTQAAAATAPHQSDDTARPKTIKP